MSIRTLTDTEIRKLFNVNELRALRAFLPHDLYGDTSDYGRASHGEDFGLDMLGEGAYAIVMQHPGDPDKVLRVALSDDGWISHAAGQPNVLRPVIHALGWTGHVWVAVAEKLMPVAEDWESRVERRVHNLFRGKGPDAEVEAARMMLDETQRHKMRLDDMDARNLMFRANGDLVINDPVSHLNDELEEQLKGQFRMREEALDAAMSPS